MEGGAGPRWKDHDVELVVADQDNNGELQYLVKWRGFSSAHNSWQLATNRWVGFEHAVNVFKGWSDNNEQAPTDQHGLCFPAHPVKFHNGGEWRKGQPLQWLPSAKPKHKRRLVADAQEAFNKHGQPAFPNNLGWKPSQVLT